MYRPYVSVIIPIFNNPEGLDRSLSAIMGQTYPKDRFEVVVVDNGSDCPPRNITERYGVIYLEEHKHLNSPYSARNRGLEQSRGEVIALLDTTCAPVTTWLEEGVAAIECSDLVGGDVVFDVNEGSTLGEMYDSLFNIRMKDSIVDRGVAKTTNLFIKRSVFDEIGVFPEGLRSGGDVRWTGKAVKEGFRIVFSEKAAVVMNTRKLSKLIIKQYRVSKGMPAIWKEQGMFLPSFIKKGILFFVPPNPAQLLAIIEKSNKHFMRRRVIGLFFVGYLLRLVSGVGVWVGLISEH